MLDITTYWLYQMFLPDFPACPCQLPHTQHFMFNITISCHCMYRCLSVSYLHWEENNKGFVWSRVGATFDQLNWDSSIVNVVNKLPQGTTQIWWISFDTKPAIVFQILAPGLLFTEKTLTNKKFPSIFPAKKTSPSIPEIYIVYLIHKAVDLNHHVSPFCFTELWMITEVCSLIQFFY